MISQQFNFKGRDISILWLLAAGLFLFFYLAGVWNLNDFEMDNKSYVIGRDIWGLATGNLSQSMMLYFDPQQVSSIVWKIFFLFPALICASMWICSRAGFTERLVVLLARFLEARWCLLGSILISFLAIIVLVTFVTRGKPLLGDEYAYVFQAKTYLTGHIAMPPPPAAESFADFHIIMQPFWVGKYLFGHPAFLAIGAALGSPYVASVTLSLATLALLFILGVRTGTLYQASVATWLVAVSPWFWFTSATLLSHVSSLFLFLVTAIGWTSLEKKPSGLVGLGIGFCMGWSFAVRPLSAVLLAIPFGYLALRNTLRDPQNWLKVCVALVVGGMAVMGLVLAYNEVITGNPLQMPFSMYWPGETIGFGRVSPIGHPGEIYHTPLRGIMNLAVSVMRANSWFLGWPLSFLPLMGLLALGFLSKSAENENPEPMPWTSWDTLWVAVIAVFCIGYISYYSSGVSDTGPVYYHELLVPLSLLSAKGILSVHSLLGRTRLERLKYLVPVFCMLSTIGSLIFFVPEKAHHVKAVGELAHHPFEMAEKAITGKAIVLVGARPLIGWMHNRPQASPTLDDRILFVRLLRNNADNNRVIWAFPDRRAYLLTYDPKGRRFQVEPYHKQ